MADNWDTMTLSVGELQEEFMEQGEAGAGAAAQRAQEVFPQKLSDLLDEGWEVMHGDSTTVHLRRKK